MTQIQSCLYLSALLKTKNNIIPNNKNSDNFNDNNSNIYWNDLIIYQNNNIIICNKNKTIVQIIIKYPNIYNNKNIDYNNNNNDDNNKTITIKKSKSNSHKITDKSVVTTMKKNKNYRNILKLMF